MKAILQALLLLLLLLISAVARAQVGIGTATPDAKAALEIKATDKGLLIPRLTAAQRTGITSPPQGLMVYQTDGTTSGGAQTGFWYYVGTGGWVLIDSAPGGLTLPYAGTAATGGRAFQVDNTGGGAGILATAAGSSPAVQGFNSGAGDGVVGTASSGSGVFANSGSGTNILSTKSGLQTGRLTAIVNYTATNDSTAVFVTTPGDRPALRAVNTATSAQAAIRGVKQAAAADGIGVEGIITNGASGNAAGVLGQDQSGSGTGSGVMGLTAGGYGVRGIASASGGYGVSGTATDSYGVIGSSQTGNGVYGSSQANANTTAGVLGVGNGGGQAVGVLGTTTSGYGVRGVASASGGYGVAGLGTDSYGVTGTSASGVGTYGISTSSYGVQGSSSSGVGVYGSSSSGYGVRGQAGSTAAVYGESSSFLLALGAVTGSNTSTSASAIGVVGLTQNGYGVRGVASGNGNGTGGVGTAGYGVFGRSDTGSGVFGYTGAGNVGGVAGVEGTSAGAGVGVLGTTGTGYGVRGEATGSNGYALIGVASGTNGIGVFGSATGGAAALYGVASGTGRAGYFNQNGSGSTANALEVQNSSVGRTAYFNQSNTANAATALEINSLGTGAALKITHPTAFNGGSTVGLLLTDPAGDHKVSVRSEYIAVETASTGEYTQIYDGHTSINTKSSQALFAFSTGTDPNFGAIQSLALSGARAAKFEGPVQVIGNLSKSGGSFQIDHPLDPANQYLYHSFVESPDMMNVYNGNIMLDAAGEATVQLPDWFEALNRDFRYQLTPIGAAFTPYVKEKVAGNKFRIAGQPGAEVSWQVTGIRHDKWADANRIPVEQAKEPANQGKYLHPTLFGQPAARGIGHLDARTAPAARPAKVPSAPASAHTSAASGQLGEAPAAPGADSRAERP